MRFHIADVTTPALLRYVILLALQCALLLPGVARCEDSGWSLGGYAGKYYDSEPAGLTQGRANFLNQNLFALTASKTIWRSDTLPLSLEIDGMLGQQFGLETLTEVAVAPVLRWSSFPWNHWLQTDLRVGPLGISYTSRVSHLERGADGNGSQTLNYLLIELAFSSPAQRSNELFVRLHHRCAVYDLLNNFGANGEDFLAFGFRRRF
jgi:hypothetical protein